MPLRALRLFPLLTSAESFTSFTLQVTVGRAWTRRPIAHTQTKISAEDRHGTTREENLTKSSSILKAGPLRYIMRLVLSDVLKTYSNDHRVAGATSTSISSCSTLQDSQVDGNSTTPFAQEQCPARIPSVDLERIDCEDTDITGTVPGCTYFDPVLNNYEPTHADLYSEEAAPFRDCLKNISSNDLSAYLTTVNIEALPPSSFSLLPKPTSARSLYHNILHILRTRKPGASLAALVDYHLLFPDHHSTKSYNLLISLSIHHRAYGITESLFTAMQHYSIQNNIETYQLHVRWFIYQGFWDRAWSYIMQSMKKFPGGTIPFPIWLEFCHTRKGRTIILDDTFNSNKKMVQKVSEPSSLFSARRKVMNTNRPLSIPALQDTPPAAIRNIVQLMVKAKLRRQALKLTEDYFKALPLELNRRMNHRCLDIVKVHLAFNGTGKTGLARFNVAKTLLFSLLSSNPSLRPTSDTLIYVQIGRASCRERV